MSETGSGYSGKVAGHYEHPRHVGAFDRADTAVGTGLVGSPASGGVMKVQIRVEARTGIIGAACFKTYGCGWTIASSSLVCEWLEGRTLDEALAIRSSLIAEELALPPVKLHCSILATDAIRAAVADYRDKVAQRGSGG